MHQLLRIKKNAVGADLEAAFDRAGKDHVKKGWLVTVTYMAGKRQWRR